MPVLNNMDSYIKTNEKLYRTKQSFIYLFYI